METLMLRENMWQYRCRAAQIERFHGWSKQSMFVQTRRLFLLPLSAFHKHQASLGHSLYPSAANQSLSTHIQHFSPHSPFMPPPLTASCTVDPDSTRVPPKTLRRLTCYPHGSALQLFLQWYS